MNTRYAMALICSLLSPLVSLLFSLFATLAHADESAWAALREGGHVLLIRHAATEPGTGDPPGFRLGDCKTQRNLSAAGREEAKRLGDAFRARQVPLGEVRSSQWCRCQETARLAFGHSQDFPALNSLFNDSRREAQQVRAVLDLAARADPAANLVLVTHNFNVRALTGISPAQAEVVVTRYEGGRMRVVGRIPPP